MKCYKNNGINNVHINKQVLQNATSKTCGRYSIVFVALHKKGVEPSVMIDFMKNGAKKYGSVDNLLLEITDDL